ncbi:hypothetical protein VQH23_17900 [Pararoseomonas sp. SCSIO 73927]|uniref:hypothetical protein n=1 Tax=Pararoseomonas sp. SCSIO 73927 TaxID=3114537 RepID=UPI0030D5123B
MSADIGNLVFYLVLLPLVAAVGSIALGILATAIAEPWARRSRSAAAARTRAPAAAPSTPNAPQGVGSLPQNPAARSPGPAHGTQAPLTTLKSA